MSSGIRPYKLRSRHSSVRFTNDGATYVRPQMHVRISRAGRVVKKLDDSTTAIFAG